MVSTELPSLIFHLTIVCLQEPGIIQSRLQLKCELETGLGAGDYWANWRKSSAAQWHEWGEQYTEEVVSSLPPNNNVPRWPCILSEATGTRFFLRSELVHIKPQTQGALAGSWRCPDCLYYSVMCHCCQGPGSLSRHPSRCPGSLSRSWCPRHSRGSWQSSQAACGRSGSIRRPPEKTPFAWQWQWQHQVQAAEWASDPAQWETPTCGHHWKSWQGCPAGVWPGLI